MSTILQRKLDDFETEIGEISRVLSHRSQHDPDDGSKDEAYFEDLEQRLAFLRTLLASEETSSGLKNPGLLKHMGDKISVLEDKFRNRNQDKTRTVEEKEFRETVTSRLDDEAELVKVLESSEEAKEEMFYICSDCEDSHLTNGDDDSDEDRETFLETGSFSIERQPLYDDDNTYGSLHKMREDRVVAKGQKEKHSAGAARFCGGMATGFIFGAALILFIATNFCNCSFNFVNHTLCGLTPT